MKIDKRLVAQISEIARQAGEVVLTHFGNSLTLKEKPDAGFVTQADTEAESFIIEQLAQIDPLIPVWAEESGKSADNSDWYWVIDPLDGTTNFAHNIPYFCVSIALTHKDEPQLGVIYNPLRKELFVASKGNGATVNGKDIHVSRKLFKDAFIAVSIPYLENPFLSATLEDICLVGELVDVRSMGSAALDLAEVAAGRFDGAFFHRLEWWDIAAGVVILQEAGAEVTDFSGKPITPQYQSLIAGSQSIYEKLLPLLNNQS